MAIKKDIYDKSFAKLEEDFSIQYLSGIGTAGLVVQSHPYYEMYMMVTGEVAYQTEAGFFKLRPGDMMFFDTHYEHCPIILNRRVPYERIVLNIQPEKLQSLSRGDIDLAECFKQKNDKFFRFPYPVQISIRSILGKLLGLKQSKSFGHEMLADAYLVELFVTITKYIRMSSSSISATELKAHELLAIIDQYIEEKIQHKISIEELAKFVCMNKYSLMRTFKSLTDVTIYQYIINKRLEIAEKKIRAGLDFSTAAYACGFSDYSCFYRAFVNHYKMSPTEYFNLENKAEQSM